MHAHKLIFFAFLATSSSATAQTLLWNFPGPFNDAQWGHSVACPGDVNLDGHADILVGTTKGGPGGNAGTVWLYSGLDGQLIWNWTGSPPVTDSLGSVVSAVGDVNNDNVPDILVGAPNSTSTGPKAVIYSGANSSLLRTLQAPLGLDSFATSLAPIGDNDLDGTTEIVVGAYRWIPNGPESGRVYVFSGATGAQRYIVNGTATNDRFGWSVSPAGDVNGDTVPDFAVGAPQSNVTPAQPGYVEFRSGTTGALIRRVNGLSNEKLFGGSLALVGDLNADGVPELAVGAPLSTLNMIVVGSVAIVSGADGARLTTWYGTTPNALFGGTLAAAGDIDRDGKPDVIVGIALDSVNGASSGTLRVISTRDGSTIMQFHGDSANDRLQNCAAGDVDGDGFPDIIGGAPNDQPGGNVKVWSSCPVPTHSYCIAAPNSQTFGALIGSTGTTSITQNNLTLTVSDATANGPGLFFYGTSAIQVPFGNGWRCVGGSIVRVPPVQHANGVGAVSRTLDFSQFPFTGSAVPAVAGTIRYFQYWYRDVAAGGASFNLSNGLAVTLCP